MPCRRAARGVPRSRNAGNGLAPRLWRGLLLSSGGLLWATAAAACSLRISLSAFIDETVATSRMYWIASILTGAVLMGLDAYQKRWSIVIVITIALLIFHPHLTASPLPMPSCDAPSVVDSQVVLVVLVMMLAYRLIRVLVQRMTARVPRNDAQQ